MAGCTVSVQSKLLFEPGEIVAVSQQVAAVAIGYNRQFLFVAGSNIEADKDAGPGHLDMHRKPKNVWRATWSFKARLSLEAFATIGAGEAADGQGGCPPG